MDLAREQPRGVAVAGEDRDAVAVGVGVDEADRVVEGRDARDAEHRAEDLVVVGPGARPHAVEQTWADEESRPRLDRRAVADDGDVVVRCARHVTRDPVAVLIRDERTEVARRVVAGADVEAIHALGDLCHERVANVAHRDDDADGHAALAGRAEARVDRGVGGDVEVGVGQHDHVVLRSAQRLDALVVRAGALVHRSGDRCRTHEANGVNARVIEQRLDTRRVTL